MRRRLGTRGSAPLMGALLGLALLRISPLFALPFALGTLASRIHPLLALLPVTYLLRTDVQRELAFHGLLPPTIFGLCWLLAIPAFGRYEPKPESP